MKILKNTTIRISRPVGGNFDGDTFAVEIYDVDSRTTVASFSVQPAALMLAISGCYEQQISNMILKNLDVAGKVRVRENRSVDIDTVEVFGNSMTSKDEMSRWLIENKHEEGWNIDYYLGSQGSVKILGGNMVRLNYSVFKYI